MTGRVPPGPEHSYLRFQQYQFDPGIKRLGSSERVGLRLRVDPNEAGKCGLGPRFWTEEDAMLAEIGEKNRVCELCAGRGLERDDALRRIRCRRCGGSGVVKKEEPPKILARPEDDHLGAIE